MKTKIIALIASVMLALAGNFVVAQPASAHQSCVRYQPKPERLLVKEHRTAKVPTKPTNDVVAVLMWTCGAVYDPDPNSHKPGTRHNATMDARFWLEARPVVPTVVVKGQRVDAKASTIERKWRRHGRVRTSEGGAEILIVFTQKLKPGLWEYRTRAETDFFGNLGFETKKTKTDPKKIRR